MTYARRPNRHSFGVRRIRVVVASLLAAAPLVFMTAWASSAADDSGANANLPRLGDALSKLKTTHAAVGLVAFSPDSSKLALTVRSANTVYVYDVADWKLVQILRGQRSACCRMYSIGFSPDSKLLAVAGMDDTVRIFDLTSGAEIVHPGVTRRVIGAVFSPDGNRLVTAGDDGVITWDAHTGAHQLTISTEKSFDALAFSPDGKMIAGGGTALKVWDAADGHELSKLENESAATSLEFSPDGATLAESEEQQVNLWGSATWQLEKGIADPRHPGSKASTYLARTLMGPAWILLGLAADQALITSQPVMFVPTTHSVAMVRDARTGGRLTHEVVVYDQSKDAVHFLNLGFVISLSFSRDGKLVAAATNGGVKVWDADSGQEKD